MELEISVDPLKDSSFYYDKILMSKQILVVPILHEWNLAHRRD